VSGEHTDAARISPHHRRRPIFACVSTHLSISGEVISGFRRICDQPKKLEQISDAG
jgi:hypothetical protein